ncbi:2OG-Fe(II) oxygenase [Flavobacterium gelidilacus]|uniref:2OG-Fe(II) oxygenase n=1 Tax=Flavobacterium gelidilacus TaxID=206041 RepID=UPI0004189ED1|nr:2OG-Fe(II) oxygenase [Flavobacterium gelidilacus]
MNDSFEELISSYIDSKIGISKDFLSEALANSLKNNLLKLYKDEELKSAGIGHFGTFAKNKEIRSDVIYWLDKENNNPHEIEFFALIEDFITYLNKECFTGIKSYEFHYALYKPGTFYKRHLDQFQDTSNRQFSMITYLNVDWKEGDGGELKVYDGEKSQIVSPINRKTVFFKSNELEHEVLETNQLRLSITGWLRKDLIDVIVS